MKTMYVRYIHFYFSIERVFARRFSTIISKLCGGQLGLLLSDEYDEQRQII